MISIDSSVKAVGKFNKKFSENEIKNEPMLFSCDLNFANKHGGEITNHFLFHILMKYPELYGRKDVIIDTRSHMLMEGWYPCIPGFHHDDVPRTRSDKQPNYHTPAYKSQHIMALVNGDICPTEFALGQVDLEEPDIGKIIYKEWHPKVQEFIKEGQLDSFRVKSDTLYHFDWQSFHQGTAAVKSGWRWFGRLSWDTDRKIHNEIRNQVQVYLEFPMEGW